MWAALSLWSRLAIWKQKKLTAGMAKARKSDNHLLGVTVEGEEEEGEEVVLEMEEGEVMEDVKYMYL